MRNLKKVSKMPAKMMPLQSRVVYGPLNSRRFGKSLGINLLPADQKVCNFDCVYCQYGESRLNRPAAFPSIDEIETCLSAYLNSVQEASPKINWITIAGNGEPTLHPEFPEVVDCLISWRDQHLPLAPIGILSNSSTCHRPEIHAALSRLDGKFMKLDVGDIRTFREINKPSGVAQWADMITGLYHLKKAVLQSLFFSGGRQNIDDALVDDWINAVHYIQPQSVQMYTLDRPPKEEGLRPVSRETLNRISRRLTAKTGITGEVFG